MCIIIGKQHINNNLQHYELTYDLISRNTATIGQPTTHHCVGVWRCAHGSRNVFALQTTTTVAPEKKPWKKTWSGCAVVATPVQAIARPPSCLTRFMKKRKRPPTCCIKHWITLVWWATSYLCAIKCCGADAIVVDEDRRPVIKSSRNLFKLVLDGGRTRR